MSANDLGRAVGEAAHWVGLVPLVWLGLLTAAGQSRGAAWWWLAGAFAVSWIADTAAHWVDPARVSLVYPVTQTALVGAVLLERRAAGLLTALLVTVGLVAAWMGGLDVLLRTVAWGAIVGIVWDRPALGRLRTALLTSFGLGLACWWAYALSPGWMTWGALQGVRALGLLLFCWAAYQPVNLKVAR